MCSTVQRNDPNGGHFVGESKEEEMARGVWGLGCSSYILFLVFSFFSGETSGMTKYLLLLNLTRGYMRVYYIILNILRYFLIENRK